MEAGYTYVIGMDMGTTNIKAIVLRSDGAVKAEASLPSTHYNPGLNMQEQDAEEWWEHVCEILQSVTGQIGEEEAQKIGGICISSHTVSMLPVAEDGTPLYRALTVQDGRSYAEMEEIVEKVGPERFVQIVGGQPAVAFLPWKILWYKRHEPQLYAKTRWYLQASSFINYRLTGVMVSDLDQALRTQCMDRDTLEWSSEIGEAMGVDLDKVLPEVKLSQEVIGHVTPEASKATGLPAGAPVLAGCSDALAAMAAIGLSRLGECGESSGTTSLVFAGSDIKSPSDVPVVTRPCPIESIPWIFDAPIQASGSALKWFIDTLAGPEKEEAELRGVNIYTYLNELALEAPAGCGGLLFFPYLQGERAPLWNNYASGMFVGMRLEMTRAELTRSIFEGTAYALRHVIETLKEEGAQIDCLRICGGGARSRAWNQIKASVLNLPVHVLNQTSGDVPVGDALMAANISGMFGSLEEGVEKSIKVDEIIQPDPEWVKIYDKLYPYFVKMYKSLDADLKDIDKTLEGLR